VEGDEEVGEDEDAVGEPMELLLLKDPKDGGGGLELPRRR
jgi:hypothetical protein